MKKQVSVRLEEKIAKDLKIEAMKNDVTVQEILENAVNNFLSDPINWIKLNKKNANK